MHSTSADKHAHVTCFDSLRILRTEFILRVLQVKKVPYISYDLASDEDAKKLWRRKAPRG